MSEGNRGKAVLRHYSKPFCSSQCKKDWHDSCPKLNCTCWCHQRAFLAEAGRKGGQATSPAKKAAARRNVLKALAKRNPHNPKWNRNPS